MHGPCHNIKYLIYNDILLNSHRFWRCKNGLLGEMPRSCLGKNGASCGQCLREHSAGSVRGAGDALRSPRRRSGSFFSHDCCARLFRTTVPHDSLRSRGRRAACESRRGVPCPRCVPRPVAAAAQRDSGVRPDAGRYASQQAWSRWRAPAQITVKSCGLPPLGDHREVVLVAIAAQVRAGGKLQRQGFFTHFRIPPGEHVVGGFERPLARARY